MKKNWQPSRAGKRLPLCGGHRQDGTGVVDVATSSRKRWSSQMDVQEEGGCTRGRQGGEKGRRAGGPMDGWTD